MASLLCVLSQPSLHHRQGSLHRPPAQGLSKAQQCSKSPQGYPSQHWPMTSCPLPPWPQGWCRGDMAAQVLPYLSHVTDDYCHDDPVDGHGLAENDAVGERQSLSTASVSLTSVPGERPHPKELLPLHAQPARPLHSHMGSYPLLSFQTRGSCQTKAGCWFCCGT